MEAQKRTLRDLVVAVRVRAGDESDEEEGGGSDEGGGVCMSCIASLY